jgi:DNA (cytosine-5)-methyltransferase 1
MLKKNFAEFFAGIGLMRIGLENEGWSISFANDIDPAKEEIYRHNFQDADEHFQGGDIHALKVEQIPTVALATASFPCNDLSVAGARDGLNGSQSSAFWGFIRLLNDLGESRPPLVLLENVTGFLTSNKGLDLQNALVALNRLGYSIDAFIIDAARFVPQSRERLFVVGCRNLPPVNDRFQSSFFESQLRPKALAQFIFDNPGVNWRIRCLPEIHNRVAGLASILENLPDESPEWWSEERAQYLLNQMSERHRKKAEEMIANNSVTYGTVFRRIRNKMSMAELRTDGLAGCLRTPRGGSGRQILFKAGKGRYQVRLLTARECARLMGADDFSIKVPLNQALFGFGDAVCVPVVQWIARNYLNPLFEEIQSTLGTPRSRDIVYA